MSGDNPYPGVECLPPPAPRERRGAPRFPANRSTAGRLSVAVGGLIRPVAIRDISVSGIDLVVRRPFEPGTHLVLELINPTTNYSRTVGVRVVHANPDRNEDWSVGFVFDSRLSQEELQALL